MNKIKKWVLFGLEFLLAVFIVIDGLIFTSGSDAMGYCILFYYLLFPVVTLIIGLFLGMDVSNWIWLFVPFAGLLGCLMPLPIFGYPGWGLACAGAFIALGGVGIGKLIFMIKGRKKTK